MYSIIILLTFLLALMAHLKLKFLLSYTNDVYENLDNKFKKLAKTVHEGNNVNNVKGPLSSVSQSTVVQTEPVIVDTNDDVVPSDEHKKIPLNPDGNALLQNYYKLTENQKKDLFQKLQGVLHDETFEYFWRSVYGTEDPYLKASYIQLAIQHMNTDVFALVKSSLDDLVPDSTSGSKTTLKETTEVHDNVLQEEVETVAETASVVEEVTPRPKKQRRTNYRNRNKQSTENNIVLN